MSLISRLNSLARVYLRRDETEATDEEEVRFYVESLTEAKIRDGAGDEADRLRVDRRTQKGTALAGEAKRRGRSGRIAAGLDQKCRLARCPVLVRTMLLPRYYARRRRRRSRSHIELPRRPAE